MNKLHFAPAAFLVAYCCAYVLVFVLDLPLFYYHPQPREFSWGWQAVQAVGPKMAWYGLMASAGIAALLAALIVPDRVLPALLRNNLWLLPVAAMLAITFQMRRFFA